MTVVPRDGGRANPAEPPRGMDAPSRYRARGAQLHGDAVFARFAAIPDVVEHGLFLNGIDTP